MEGLVILAVFTGLDELARKGPGPELFNDALPNEIRDIGVLYIVLAIADLIVVFLSIILLFGIEPAKLSCWYFYPWIVFYPFYIIYEATINIYYWVEAFKARDEYTSPLPPDATQRYILDYTSTRLGFLIVPIVYWAIKTIVILVFWFIVIFFCLESNKERKALKAIKQPVVEQQISIPQQPIIQCSGIHRATDAFVARGCQSCQAGVSTPVYRPAVNAGFQPGTYDRAGPYCAQRGCGYNPAGPYRIY
jgi:hypothetical protein